MNHPIPEDLLILYQFACEKDFTNCGASKAVVKQLIERIARAEGRESMGETPWYEQMIESAQHVGLERVCIPVKLGCDPPIYRSLWLTFDELRRHATQGPR